MDQNLRFIGVVQSPLRALPDCPRLESEGAPPAVLCIAPAFQEAAKDLRPGARIWVLTWLHKADRNVLETFPRDNTALPLTGVFSTRSPDRPNPIGLHFVHVVSVTAGEITVSGMETLDQTPLLDIKPVLKYEL